jgi:hypothetical protein
MKRKICTAILLLGLSCFAYLEATSARTWEPGVAKGDFFYYEMYGVFTSSDPNAVIEVPAFEQNTTDWVRIDITGVSGSVVYQAYTLHFKNRTEKFELKTDLDPSNAGSFNFSEMGVPICAANLDVGDLLPTVQLTIKETLIRTYSSGERETNLVSWNISEDWGRCYFDRETGMLIDLYRVHSFVNPVTGETIYKADVVKMTRSSLWENAEAPKKTHLPLFIVCALLNFVIIAVRWNRGPFNKVATLVRDNVYLNTSNWF